MTKLDAQTIKRALTDAGVEVYRTQEGEIHVAERIRLHIMDSGIRVKIAERLKVLFTARSQQSDFPNHGADVLFNKVRDSVGTAAGTRGYVEAGAVTTQVTDPVDKTKILDVWHEVTYEKEAQNVDSLVDEVRWALDVEKYIAS